MKTSASAGYRYIGVLLSMAFLSSANPVDPTYFPFLSEIQMTDSIHWNVEANCNYPMLRSVINPPCSTDSLLLFCWQNSSSPPDDSMRRPVIHEVFDSIGIAVLTPQHFPGLKLVKGWYVFLKIKFGSVSYSWSTQIPTSLTSKQSVVSYTYQTCCFFDPGTGQCLETCTKFAYSVSNTPTIGLPNSSAAVSVPENGPSAGSRIRFLPQKTRGQVSILISGTFAGQGTVEIFSANGSLVQSLPFASRGVGTYTVRWDGCNGQGKPIPAGTYVCRVSFDKEVVCKGFVAW